MKKRDIIILQNGINSVGYLPGFKFAYALNRNNAIIKDEVEALQKALNPSPEFVELVSKFAKKDANGNAIVENGDYIYENIGEEQQKVIDARKDQVKQYDALLDEEVNIELYKIAPEEFPKDITGTQLAGIFSIIKE